MHRKRVKFCKKCETHFSTKTYHGFDQFANVVQLHGGHGQMSEHVVPDDGRRIRGLGAYVCGHALDMRQKQVLPVLGPAPETFSHVEHLVAANVQVPDVSVDLEDLQNFCNDRLCFAR